MNAHTDNTRDRVAGVSPATAEVLMRQATRGFTLAEILVVLGIIVVAMAIVVPVAMGLLNTSGDAEARSWMSGMLATARAAAIEHQTYALLHVQIGLRYDAKTGLWSDDEAAWACPMIGRLDGSGNWVFAPPGGEYRPRRAPAGMAFGEISGTYVGSSAYNNIADDVTTAGPTRDFTTFNVVYGPDGSLAPSITPVLDQTQVIFAGNTRQKVYLRPNNSSDKINNIQPTFTLNERCVRAFTMFEYRGFARMTPAERKAHLDKVGVFMALNPSTGMLISQRSRK